MPYVEDLDFPIEELYLFPLLIIYKHFEMKRYEKDGKRK